MTKKKNLSRCSWRHLLFPVVYFNCYRNLELPITRITQSLVEAILVSFLPQEMWKFSLEKTKYKKLLCVMPRLVAPYLFEKKNCSLRPAETVDKKIQSCRCLERRSALTRLVNLLVTSLRSGVSLLSVSFSYSEAQSAIAKFTATAKLIETICFAGFAIFHVYLIQIYFESKYSEKVSYFWFRIHKIRYSIICILNHK